MQEKEIQRARDQRKKNHKRNHKKPVVRNEVKQEENKAEEGGSQSKVTEAEDDILFRPKREKKNFIATLFGCCTSKSKEPQHLEKKPEPSQLKRPPQVREAEVEAERLDLSE